MEIIDLPTSSDKTRFAGGIVFTEYFDSERKFRRALTRHEHRLPFSIDEIMEHERAHVEAARNLGYRAQYCLTRNGIYFQPSSWINDGKIREIPIDDLIVILSAPKEPGYDDKLKIDYLKSFKKAFCQERR